MPYPHAMVERASVTDLTHALLFTLRLISLSETRGGSPRLRSLHLALRAVLIDALGKRVAHKAIGQVYAVDPCPVCGTLGCGPALHGT